MGRSFDESKVSRDKEGRFKDQNKHHTPTDLLCLPVKIFVKQYCTRWAGSART